MTGHLAVLCCNHMTNTCTSSSRMRSYPKAIELPQFVEAEQLAVAVVVVVAAAVGQLVAEQLVGQPAELVGQLAAGLLVGQLVVGPAAEPVAVLVGVQLAVAPVLEQGSAKKVFYISEYIHQVGFM